MASILEIDPEEAGMGAAAATFGRLSGPQRLPQNLGSILGQAGGAYTAAKNDAALKAGQLEMLKDQAAQREMAVIMQIRQQRSQEKFQSILGQQRASGQPLDEISILNAGLQSGAFGPKETTEFMGKVMEKQNARQQRMDELRVRLDDQRQAREDREKAQRDLVDLQAQHRQDLARLQATLQPKQERMVPVEENGQVVYVPQSQAAGRQVGKPGQPNKSLTPQAIKQLADTGETATTFIRLQGQFKDEYGGKGSQMIGDAENLIGRNIGAGKGEQANWWQDYQNQKNIVRNKLFGSALTATEAAEFDKANINPGMTPEIIKQNLTRQRSAAVRAARKLSQAYKVGGYSEDQIHEALGLSEEDLADTSAPVASAKPWEKRR